MDSNRVELVNMVDQGPEESIPSLSGLEPILGRPPGRFEPELGGSRSQVSLQIRGWMQDQFLFTNVDSFIEGHRQELASARTNDSLRNRLISEARRDSASPLTKILSVRLMGAIGYDDQDTVSVLRDLMRQSDVEFDNTDLGSEAMFALYRINPNTVEHEVDNLLWAMMSDIEQLRRGRLFIRSAARLARAINSEQLVITLGGLATKDPEIASDIGQFISGQ